MSRARLTLRLSKNAIAGSFATKFPALRGRAVAVTAFLILSACAGGAGGGGSEAALSLRLADRAVAGGDFQTAATFYRQAFEQNPRSREALVGLGRAYSGMGQHVRGEQALLEASRRRPNDPQVLLELARIQISAGKALEALANLEEAAAHAPDDLDIIVARGIALDRLSRHAEAQEHYGRGLARDPTHFALLSNLGLSLGLSGRGEDGIMILRDLVRDPSATATTRGNLALLYALTGHEREARTVLASDLTPDQIDQNIAYYRELRSLLMQGWPIGDRV